MASIQDLSKYITDEMRRNVDSPDAKQTSLLRVLPGSYHIALFKWASLVAPEKKWDHKADINEKFGMWCFDPVTKFEFYGDIWSNVHYGYIGLSIGFSEAILKMGAGVAQLVRSGVPETFGKECKESAGAWACLPAFDNPNDQASIQIGFDLWNTYGRRLVAANVCDIVRSRRAMLTARRKSS